MQHDLKIMLRGMKNWSKDTRSHNGIIFAGQKRKKAYNMSITLHKNIILVTLK